MAYQEGAYNLTTGILDYTIPFPTPFTLAPGVVLPVVRNISADATKLLINATVVATTNADFTVRLSGAPNTNNYQLAWVAGDISTIFQAVSVLGIRMSQLSLQGNQPADADYFPFVSTVSLPVSKRITFGVLRGMFVNYVATPPASPAAPGDIGDYSVDTEAIYFHTGVQWGKLSLQLGSWDVPSAPVVQQEAQVTLSSGNAAPTITFPVPFTSVPKISSLVFGNTVPGQNLMLSGFVTSVTLTNFSLALAGPPDNSTYYVNYTARQY